MTEFASRLERLCLERIFYEISIKDKIFPILTPGVYDVQIGYALLSIEVDRLNLHHLFLTFIYTFKHSIIEYKVISDRIMSEIDRFKDEMLTTTNSKTVSVSFFDVANVSRRDQWVKTADLFHLSTDIWSFTYGEIDVVVKLHIYNYGNTSDTPSSFKNLYLKVNSSINLRETRDEMLKCGAFDFDPYIIGSFFADDIDYENEEKMLVGCFGSHGYHHICCQIVYRVDDVLM